MKKRFGTCVESRPDKMTLTVTNLFIFLVLQSSGVLLFDSIFPDLGGHISVRLCSIYTDQQHVFRLVSSATIQ